MPSPPGGAVRLYPPGMGNLLVVEDDEELAALLRRHLERDGHHVVVVAAGLIAWSEAVVGQYDVVVLDLGLPDIDGVEVCRRIRRDAPTVPVLMLTARSDEADVIGGLDAGADDYLTKPFRIGELLARVRGTLRRTAPETISVGALRIEVAARRAFIADTELVLRPKEFDLLRALARRAGQVVTRETLMGEVWDEHWDGPTKTLDVHVTWIRAKLKEAGGDAASITTVRGVGLRLEHS